MGHIYVLGYISIFDLLVAFYFIYLYFCYFACFLESDLFDLFRPSLLDNYY